MKDKVDVLIIGAGASDAAAAWSFAETKMRIPCQEKGDWMKSNPSIPPMGGTSTPLRSAITLRARISARRRPINE
jgi:succinate dehydrogenase/fumarate reductase flavoprotein subunit